MVCFAVLWLLCFSCFDLLCGVMLFALIWCLLLVVYLLFVYRFVLGDFAFCDGWAVCLCSLFCFCSVLVLLRASWLLVVYGFLAVCLLAL